MSEIAREVVTEAKLRTSSTSSSVVPDLPVLGFRNYWYPVIESRQVRRHPVSVRLLGEDIVLFRSEGKLGALVDRCPHRGARLSLGRTIFPGTLTCGYHGATFNRKGECVAFLVDGPSSLMPRTMKVHAYPVEERFGIIWTYMGSGEPPPLEEDLPSELQEPNVALFFILEKWACDWRNGTENILDVSHPILVHRRSLRSLFQKMPAWVRSSSEPLPDGKGVLTKVVDSGLESKFPGLGEFPAHSWWRVVPRKGAFQGLETRLPGYALIKKRETSLGRLTEWVWPVPVDKNQTLVLVGTIVHSKNLTQKLIAKARWWLYLRPVNLQFQHQDRRIIGPQNYRDPEKLAPCDVGVMQFRRLAAKFARQPHFPAHNEHGAADDLGGPKTSE